MMKKVLAFSVLFFSLGCAHNSVKNGGELRIGSNAFILKKSSAGILPGKFFLSLDHYDEPAVFPSLVQIAVLNEDGELDFQSSFRHSYNVAFVADFKPVGRDLLGYFFCSTAVRDRCPGSYHFLNSDYATAFPFPPFGEGQGRLNVHNMAVSPRGTYFFAFKEEHPEKGYVDHVVKEFDVHGRVLFEWHSRDRYFVGRSKTTPADADLNSIAIEADGTLLLNFRQTGEMIELQYPSGKITGRISGLEWKFMNDEYQGFSYQHSPEILPNGHLLLFDNGNGTRSTRAVEYSLNRATKTATLVWEKRAPAGDPFRAFGGSVQRLANGNTLIAWGRPATKAGSDAYLYPMVSLVNQKGETLMELLSRRLDFCQTAYFQEAKD